MAVGGATGTLTRDQLSVTTPALASARAAPTIQVYGVGLPIACEEVARVVA